MARRKPAGALQSEATAAHRLSADDHDVLLTDAKVPKTKREVCARGIDEHLAFYNDCLNRKAAPSEASQAESLRLVVEAAKELRKVLAALPPGLRLAVEPDYWAFGRKCLAMHVARSTAYAMAARELAAGDPDAQWLADQTASLPLAAREYVKRASRKSRATAPLPLEFVLAALIDTTEKRRTELEKQVSRQWTKRRSTLARNELALNLKEIAITYSPTLAKNNRAAEDWTAEVLQAANIRYPARLTNQRAFRAMFTPAIR